MEKLSENSKASRALQTKAARYCLVDGQLYRRSYQGQLARCLGASEADYVIREVHEEISGNHSGADSLVLNLIMAAYYWPQMEHDANKFVQKCDKCQRHSQIPKEIACDNGPQFIGSKVTNFLEDLKIKRITSSPYHPRANGQATSTNKVIIQNLKKKLEDDKGKWPEELPGVLWAYRTIAKSSTGETPFSLVYGAEALISMEVGEPTLRFSQTNEETNNEEFLVRRDLLDEHRDLAYVMMVAQNQRMEIYYSRRANLRYFKVGDLILRKVILNTQEVNAGSWDQHGKVLIGFQLSPKKCRTS
nr:uncharacterized protein LOC117274846 [Nicotiana tomentosiformis]